MKPLAISAVIITQDEAHNIRRCLESLAFCEDIVVVDSGSTDDTVTIAESLGARVIEQPWLGYGPQKQFAVEQARFDWVLCLDADEVISGELKQSISALALDDTHQPMNYHMPRRNHFLGRALGHGEGYPDLSLRFFNRTQAHWSNDVVHEGVQTQGEIGRLNGDLLHFSEETLSSYITKQNHYTQLQAQILFDKGKRASALKCFTSPLIRFIKFYFIRLGFLDGIAGFTHISIGCFNTFSKYAKLIELHQQHKHQPEQSN